MKASAPTIEYRTVKQAHDISAAIAQDLTTRCVVGPAAVVVESPRPFLSALRKRWLRLTRGVDTSRASTLNAAKLYSYASRLAQMQSVVFAAGVPDDITDADVYIVTLEDAPLVVPHCATVYVVSPLSESALSELRQRSGEWASVIRFVTG